MQFKSKKTLFFIVCLFISQIITATTVTEVFTIFSMYLKKPAEVGEIAPMSESVGDELSRFISQDYVVHVLEAGGGCGSVTQRIVKVVQELEQYGRYVHLDVVEINPEMYNILKKRFAGYSNVTIHCCSILDWHPSYSYDVIISTLPFNSLGVQFAHQVIEHFKQLASKGCCFSYVEYPIVDQILKYFYGQDRKTMFLQVQKYMLEVRKMYLKETKMIYLNIPPINIYHLSL